jgi:hypothetical protein
MSTTDEQKCELLMKTAAFYQQSIEDYASFCRTERKPRTKRQLQQRLNSILQEIETLKSSS